MKNSSIILILLFSSHILYGQLTGDYYDNRDDNHAKMPISPHPELSKMSSGYGIQDKVIPDTIVFGNASLAYTTGDNWGSLIRVRNLRSQYGMTKAYNLYINNNAYWYPEHRDHDMVDYFFTQAPMLNNSQGSSGSEIDELHKWFYTLAAFIPSVKETIKSNKLIIPTMQMIARRSRVTNDMEYLTGMAHPNAFDNADVRSEMEAMASSMTSSTVPPMVQIEALEEDYNGVQIDSNYWFFEPVENPRLKESMHKTPVSITRIWHGLQYTKRMVVSAENSYDINGLPLTYHWAILRGDSSHISINPLNDNNSKVEILIDYHSEDTIVGSNNKLSNLVSIGAFVHNGHYFSAPAFVTSYTKRNEERVYNQTTKKIESITYNDNYLDPKVSNEKDWDRDVFSYDDNDDFNGWIRHKGSIQDVFTKEGYVVIEEDNNGNPTLVSKVSYTRMDSKTIWKMIGQPFAYLPNYVGVYEKNDDIIIFPNPVLHGDVINIKTKDYTHSLPLLLEIFSNKGNLLKTVYIKDCETKINLSDLSPTNYIFRISPINRAGQQMIETVIIIK